MKRKAIITTVTLALGASALVASAADWPFWGGSASRNMVSTEMGLTASWDAGRYKQNSDDIDIATTKNVKWIAKLGSQSYGNPTVAGGRIFVGTNNETPRDERLKGDRAVLMCLDEKTGNLQWQLAIPKLGTGKISDWEFLGLCSSPAVDGDRVYVVTNRCEVMCLDVKGQSDGNQGFQDEGKYFADKGKPAVEIKPTDADILWKYDMREELGVFPHNITNCGPLILGDKVVVTTSNGVDWGHTGIPNPKAPALAMLNKMTGEYIAEEGSGVSSRTLHSNWSSPAGGLVNGKETIIFGGGDGICYGFSTTPKDKNGLKVFTENWRRDANPPEYRTKAGKPLKYATFEGPSEVIATPVLRDGKVYFPIGQDPEHGEGLGQFNCLDATTGKVLWTNKTLHRSLSTPSLYNGLIFVADFSGFVHCLDQATGKTLWKFDTKSHIWASTLVADGKIWIGTEDGDIIQLAATRTMKELGRVDMRSPVYASVVAANKTIYVATPTHLYAIGTGGATASVPVKHDPKALARMEARSDELRAEHDHLANCQVQGVPHVAEK